MQPRVQRALLCRAGLLKPRLATADRGALETFASEGLDEFLRRLLYGAARVAAFGPNQANIPAAAKKACCSAAEIVQAILDGRLTRKARLASECGYMAVDDGDGLDVPAGDQLADDLIIRLQALGERRGGEAAVVGARTRRHMGRQEGCSRPPA
jgi:hypothetical protein